MLHLSSLPIRFTSAGRSWKAKGVYLLTSIHSSVEATWALPLWAVNGPCLWRIKLLRDQALLSLILLWEPVTHIAHLAFVMWLTPNCDELGSILIGCAHFGAITMGGDIDPRVLRGDTKLNQQYTGNVFSTRPNFFKLSDNLHPSQRALPTSSPILLSTRWRISSWIWLLVIVLDPAGG